MHALGPALPPFAERARGFKFTTWGFWYFMGHLLLMMPATYPGFSRVIVINIIYHGNFVFT